MGVPAARRRYELLEDALQLLPLLWGKGSPRFEGRTVTVPEAICYPRPLQDHIPILVGGSGERRTLRLVARYADACNLFGDAATVRHKVDVLHRHCADLDRDPGRGDGDEPDVGPRDRRRRRTTGRGNAGTVDEQVGRYRAYAEAGVQTAIVSLPDVAEGGIERFAPVIAAFRLTQGERWARSGASPGRAGGELVEGDVDRPLQLRIAPVGDVGRRA